MWWLLLPGLHLKRHLLAAVVGLVAVGVGIGWALAGDGAHAGFTGVLIVAGGLLTVAGALRSWRSVTEAVGSETWAGRFVSRYLSRGPRVVAIGGGTGLPAVLRGLKHYTSNLTAVVTVADDGGSSGRLRGELGILPPGDIRNCMVALADTEPAMANLFQFRFRDGQLAGHSFGNLFLAAMEQTQGDFVTALKESSRVLAVRGQVLPATLDQVVLCAELEDGTMVRGESAIGQSAAPIRRVWLEPAEVTPLAEAVRAVQEADLVVVGPGSLFTSVLPNLLIRPIQEALRASEALRVYVVNVMTQPGETVGYSVWDHLRTLERHVGSGLFDVVLANNQPIPAEIGERYRREGGAEPVAPGIRPEGGRVELVTAALLDSGFPDGVVRHDPEKLSRTLLRLLLDRRRRRWEGRVMDALWLENRLKERERGEHPGRAARTAPPVATPRRGGEPSTDVARADPGSSPTPRR